MTDTFDHDVTADEQGTRLDVLVASLDLEERISRSAAVRLIESGRVLVNGLSASKKQLVVFGDSVHIELVRRTGISENIVPNFHIPLDIRYEDEHLIVLSKQAGLVCHPAKNHYDDTLANALVAHFGIEHLAEVQGADRPGIVHRLDSNTSGLMLAAKTDIAAARLQDGIRTREIDRRYLALVHGLIAPEHGMVDAPIGRDPKNRVKMTVVDGVTSRSAITTFVVLERFDAGVHDEGYTLVECHLYTGRTHQIRVHMEYIKHPVVGDPLYGRTAHAKAHRRESIHQSELGLKRQFLHSWRLSFKHPMSAEQLSFQDTLPADLQVVLDSLKQRSMGRSEIGCELLG